MTDGQAKSIPEGSQSSPIQLHAVSDSSRDSACAQDPSRAIASCARQVAKTLLQAGVLKGLWWTDTRSMLADDLTKGSVDRSALESATNGWIEIHHALTNESIALSR